MVTLRVTVLDVVQVVAALLVPLALPVVNVVHHATRIPLLTIQGAQWVESISVLPDFDFTVRCRRNKHI